VAPRSTSSAHARARVAALVVLVSLGGLLFGALRLSAAPPRGEPGRGASREADDVVSEPSAVAGRDLAGGRRAAPVATDLGSAPSGPSLLAGRNPEEVAVQRAARVSDALELLKYSPDSQPLRRDMVDVLAPNRRYESAMPLAMATGRTGDPPKQGDLSFVLTGDVYSVVGKGALAATLEVFRESATGERERVAVDVNSCALSIVEAAGSRPIAGAALLNDEGRDGDATAGDKVYGRSLVPAAVPALAAYRGLVRLDVEFTAADGDRRPARASLDFRLAASVPAVVSGVAGERLTPDGLEISVDLRVDEAGHYFVQGLLFDANDAPIGFAVARPRLEVGRARVPILFWGLLMREAKRPGPYVFRAVTGHRLPEPNERDRVDMATWEGPYRTSAYALSDFSDKEYESPSKELKIQALAALAAAKRAR
jgi:hypothetical protein